MMQRMNFTTLNESITGTWQIDRQEKSRGRTSDKLPASLPQYDTTDQHNVMLVIGVKNNERSTATGRSKRLNRDRWIEAKKKHAE